MDSINQMSSFVNKGVNLMNNNKILSSILAMFLVLYAAMAAPKLPKNIVKMFDNVVVKLVYMFLMAYLVSKNPSVAIISAVGLLITIQTLSYYEASDSASQKIAQIVNSKQQIAVEKLDLNKVSVNNNVQEMEKPAEVSSESPKDINHNIPQPVDVAELAPFESDNSTEQVVSNNIPSEELNPQNQHTELSGYESGVYAEY